MMNLHTLFPSLQLYHQKPLHQLNYYLFYNRNEQYWLQIEKSEVSKRDYEWLQQLFLEEKNSNSPWEQFLFQNGSPPTKENIRIIQLYTTQPYDRTSLKIAVNTYFNDEVIIVPTSSQSALLIEQQKTFTYTTNDFSSFIAALESDFYIRATIYIGKFHPCNETFPTIYHYEEEWFEQSSFSRSSDRVFTMESLFLTYFDKMLSSTAKQLMQYEILKKIEHEPELLKTVQAFFELGFNASATAKELHIHRNTLLYRLNKFQELTDLPIKQFDGALIAYLTKFINE